MSLSVYSSIVFSKDLAGKTVDQQREAVEALKTYIVENAKIVACASEAKIDRIFEPYFNGEIDALKPFADAAEIAFQPEILRGTVTTEQVTHMKTLGFDSFPFGGS